MNVPTFEEVMALTDGIREQAILMPVECEAMYEVLCGLPDGATVAEVGCDSGRSSSLISQVAAAKDFLTIHVDPWREFPERAKDWMQNVAERSPWHRFIVLHMSTELAATSFERLTPDGLDFVFIDGSHDQDKVELDMQIVVSRVKPGGYLLAHDYPSAGVSDAIDPFTAANGFTKVKQAHGMGVWRR